MGLLVIANLLWVALSLPIVTMPPATAGLFALTNRLANGERARLSDYFQGVRTYLLRSWQLVLADAIVPIIVLGNFAFYAQSQGALVTFLFGIWTLTLLYWLAMQPYLFPLMLEQVDKRLRITARNAALMVIKGPIFTLILLLISAAAITVSLLLVVPLLFVTASFLALLYNYAVIERLKPYREAHGTTG